MKINREIMEDLGFEFQKESNTYKHTRLAGLSLSDESSLREVHERIVKISLHKEREKIKNWLKCALLFD